MKKLLALILCVMLFVSVIPMAAFAAEASSGTSASSGKVTADTIKAKIAEAIKTKNDAAKQLCKDYDDAVKAWMEDADKGFLALQNKAVDSILANYNTQAQNILDASKQAYTDKLNELTESINAEFAKMFPSAS